MYLDQVIEGADAVEFCEEKMKADLAKIDLKRVKKVELYSANIADDGEDFCEIRLVDSSGNVMLMRRVLSY